jgi:hypothetical protein
MRQVLEKKIKILFLGNAVPGLSVEFFIGIRLPKLQAGDLLLPLLESYVPGPEKINSKIFSNALPGTSSLFRSGDRADNE